MNRAMRWRARRWRLALCVLAAAAAAPLGAGLGVGEERAGPLDWPPITRDCRPWAYNWWLGSAVDRENLSRELERYRRGGLGGVHVVPIYGAKGAESRYLEFLGPRWLEMWTFAVEEARRKGLGIDLTTGTGWCFGGPHVPPDLGCRQRVVKRILFPDGGRLPEDLRPPRVTVQAVVARGPGGEKRNLTGRLKEDGTLRWTPAAAGWSISVLGHRFSGRRVKRAAPGGAGPMINPFCAASMETYLRPFTAAFDRAGVARPRAMYHDSFEYSGDWSPDLPAAFARRRGYRIEDELEALAGRGDADRVARVRCDVQETLSDLIVEDVFPRWVAWCHERGMLTRNQAHGAPANWLDFYAVADIPETEMFGHGGPDPLVSRFDEHLGGADRDPLISKFASSAAHLAGKPLVSAETGTWLAEHFCETFEELKGEIDLMFLAGVNHIFYHGCVYSPDDAAWPGWLFYASTQMNPRNPLWREAPALNEYAARCQALLRSGRPSNDVLLYWPIHDAWSRGVGNMSVHNKAALEGPLGEAARKLWARGWGFDYVSDRQLGALRARAGAIESASGATWRAVVVPACRQIPLATLRALLSLADDGATVIFEKALPADVPGLGRLEERRAALRRLLEPLRARAARAGGGVRAGSVGEMLEAAGVGRETLADRPGLKFIRRRHEKGWLYLIVNHATRPIEDWIPLATSLRSAAVLDPMTGRTGVASVRRRGRSGAGDGRGAARGEVYVRLEPAGSIFLRTFETEQVEGPAWRWAAPGEAVREIGGPWTVEFVEGGPSLPPPMTMDGLVSWTAGGSADREAFAGTALYRAAFDVAPRVAAASARAPLLLDLGEVKHVARARLNGRDLGARFLHPYRVEVPPGLLSPGGNRLEVEVTNLAANRIRDLDRRKVVWRKFHDINLVNIRYRAFDASKWPLFESGLLGPVTLRGVAAAGAGAGKARREEPRRAARTYHNPIIPHIGPADPAVILHEGRYYLYPTWDGKGYDVFVSGDLVHWERKPKCYVDPRGGAWAPDVFHHRSGDGKWYLYYTVDQHGGGKLVGVAAADGPLGPFADRGVLVRGAIDAHLFRDRDGGLYLYYVDITRGPFRILVQPMADPLHRKGAPAELLRPSQPWEMRRGSINEGPWMLESRGIYYLMYSGSGADGPDYAIGYATSDSPVGPFTKYEGNPIARRGHGVFGPGHHSVVTGPDEGLWMVYHQQLSERTGWNRFLAIDPLWFDERGVLHARTTRGTDEPMDPALRLPRPAALAERLPCRARFLRVEDRPAFLLRPASGAASSPAPWVWYAPTLPRHPDPSHEWLLRRLLERGVAVAGVDVGESYGNPRGRWLYTRLWEKLVRGHGLAPRPCLLAQSRGGLMLYNWAAEHPDRVGGIAGIYPVCDLRSWPGLARAAPAYGLTEAKLAQTLAAHNPVDRLEPLARAGVPILHLHGDSDRTVPLEANSAELARRYRRLGGTVELITVAGRGHQVCDEFFRRRELVEFIARCAGGT